MRGHALGHPAFAEHAAGTGLSFGAAAGRPIKAVAARELKNDTLADVCFALAQSQSSFGGPQALQDTPHPTLSYVNIRYAQVHIAFNQLDTLRCQERQ